MYNEFKNFFYYSTTIPRKSDPVEELISAFSKVRRFIIGIDGKSKCLLSASISANNEEDGLCFIDIIVDVTETSMFASHNLVVEHLFKVLKLSEDVYLHQLSYIFQKTFPENGIDLESLYDVDYVFKIVRNDFEFKTNNTYKTTAKITSFPQHFTDDEQIFLCVKNSASYVIKKAQRNGYGRGGALCANENNSYSKMNELNKNPEEHSIQGENHLTKSLCKPIQMEQLIYRESQIISSLHKDEKDEFKFVAIDSKIDCKTYSDITRTFTPSKPEFLSVLSSLTNDQNDDFSVEKEEQIENSNSLTEERKDGGYDGEHTPGTPDGDAFIGSKKVVKEVGEKLSDGKRQRARSEGSRNKFDEDKTDVELLTKNCPMLDDTFVKEKPPSLGKRCHRSTSKYKWSIFYDWIGKKNVDPIKDLETDGMNFRFRDHHLLHKILEKEKTKFAYKRNEKKSIQIFLDRTYKEKKWDKMKRESWIQIKPKKGRESVERNRREHSERREVCSDIMFLKDRAKNKGDESRSTKTYQSMFIKCASKFENSSFYQMVASKYANCLTNQNVDSDSMTGRTFKHRDYQILQQILKKQRSKRFLRSGDRHFHELCADYVYSGSLLEKKINENLARSTKVSMKSRSSLSECGTESGSGQRKRINEFKYQDYQILQRVLRKQISLISFERHKRNCSELSTVYGYRGKLLERKISENMSHCFDRGVKINSNVCRFSRFLSKDSRFHPDRSGTKGERIQDGQEKLKMDDTLSVYGNYEKRTPRRCDLRYLLVESSPEKSEYKTVEENFSLACYYVETGLQKSIAGCDMLGNVSNMSYHSENAELFVIDEEHLRNSLVTEMPIPPSYKFVVLKYENLQSRIEERNIEIDSSIRVTEKIRSNTDGFSGFVLDFVELENVQYIHQTICPDNKQLNMERTKDMLEIFISQSFRSAPKPEKLLSSDNISIQFIAVEDKDVDKDDTQVVSSYRSINALDENDRVVKTSLDRTSTDTSTIFDSLETANVVHVIVGKEEFDNDLFTEDLESKTTSISEKCKEEIIPITNVNLNEVEVYIMIYQSTACENLFRDAQGDDLEKDDRAHISPACVDIYQSMKDVHCISVDSHPRSMGECSSNVDTTDEKEEHKTHDGDTENHEIVVQSCSSTTTSDNRMHNILIESLTRKELALNCQLLDIDVEEATQIIKDIDSTIKSSKPSNLNQFKNNFVKPMWVWAWQFHVVLKKVILNSQFTP